MKKPEEPETPLQSIHRRVLEDRERARKLLLEIQPKDIVLHFSTCMHYATRYLQAQEVIEHWNTYEGEIAVLCIGRKRVSLAWEKEGLLLLTPGPGYRIGAISLPATTQAFLPITEDFSIATFRAYVTEILYKE